MATSKRKAETAPPEGFRYAAEAITPEMEAGLVAECGALPLVEFVFQGYTGKRRVYSFGWHYSFETGRLEEAHPLPEWLLPARAVAADFAGLAPDDLPHALITQYGPGAAIGWHRDRGAFGDVVGLSLLAPCQFRLRREVTVTSLLETKTTWERYTLTAEPMSIYLLRGPARTEWEHSIPGVEALRYSITFRSLRAKR